MLPSNVPNPAIICHRVRFQISAARKANSTSKCGKGLKRNAFGSRGSQSRPAREQASLPPSHSTPPPPTSLATQEPHANSSSAQAKGASSGELTFFFPWGHGVPKGQGQNLAGKTAGSYEGSSQVCQARAGAAPGHTSERPDSQAAAAAQP